MLSLRAYSSLPNVFVAPGGNTQPASAPPANDQHQAMIAELSRQTGMVPEYSEMCLSQVEWQFDKALIIFNEKKVRPHSVPIFGGQNQVLTCLAQASLPAEAFATPGPH